MTLICNALLLTQLFISSTVAYKISNCRHSKLVHTKQTSLAAFNDLDVAPKSSRDSQLQSFWSVAKFVSTAAIVALPTSAAFAVQGSIKPSTLAETKDAVNQLKTCLDGLRIMEEAASKQEWQVIGDLLSTKPYMKFEDAATTLVRSDAVSAEDKQSLGTIKRYGLVADAIIMLGGLGAELKGAGIKVAGVEFQGIPDNGDEEEEVEEEVKKPRVNGGEVRRFIKLSKDALGDIYRIVAPILNK